MAQSIFSSDWWLNAVCEGHAVGRFESAGCSAPFVLNRHWGIGRLLMPRLTQAFDLEGVNACCSAEAVRSFARNLWPFALRKLALQVSLALYIDDAVADIFRSEGYVVEQRVSYRIDTSVGDEALFRALHDEKRRAVRKGQRAQLCLGPELSADDFFDFVQRNLKARDRSVSYDRKLITSLLSAASARSACKVLTAQAPNGDVAAAVLLVWDSSAIYYLIPSFSAEWRSSGAMEWLTFESIRFAAAKGLVFDFEGSMDPGIARAYRHFGSSPRFYYRISRSVF